MSKQIVKAHNHDYFFTFNNVVHEVYRTIRGKMCRRLFEIDYPNKDRLCEIDILLINSQLYNN